MTGFHVVAMSALLSVAPAAKAKQLAAQKNYDELYLAFASGDPSEASEADRKVIAAALLKGCLALQKSDGVMAQSLGERALAFDPSAEATVCTALAAKKSEQRGAAEGLLTAGATQYPTDARFALELGRFHLEDRDADKAQQWLSRVPPATAQGKEAKRLIAQAIALEKQGAAPVAPGRDEPTSTVSGNSWSSEQAADGHRTRGNAFFTMHYFNRQQDFGQRAEYEGTVQAALEEARVTAKRYLTVARQQPTDVVLYSADEFKLHFGDSYARSIAGFYTENAIRMNHAVKITDETRETLVHEYVHAVLDELMGFKRGLPIWFNEGLATWVEWQYAGKDGPMPRYAAALQQQAQAGDLPSLTQFNSRPLVETSNPPLAYALSGKAVGLLVQLYGMPSVIKFINETAQSRDPENAFKSTFGTEMKKFDARLTTELSGG